jgi:hypothetical protein
MKNVREAHTANHSSGLNHKEPSFCEVAQQKSVIDAISVMFMVTRPPGVVVRDLTILPHGCDI